jgi:aspartyl-tRNA(Asn)/glutamyl-tRNA(Gln) amidotransferase subunit A
MCRTVGDDALLLQAIAGYDPQDSNSVDAPVPDYAQALRSKVTTLRLGVPRVVFFEQIDPEIEKAVNQAIEALAKLTAGGVHDVQLPRYPNLPMIAAEAYAYHASYLVKTPELYQPSTRARLEAGTRVTAEAYIQGRRELDRVRRAVRDVFAEVDVLITPTTPVSPATIAESADQGVPAPGGVALSLRNTQPFDIYGLPTISIPCGFTSAGMPIGLQISGPHFGEQTVLALAHAYEQATEWHKRRPGNTEPRA